MQRTHLHCSQCEKWSQDCCQYSEKKKKKERRKQFLIFLTTIPLIAPHFSLIWKMNRQTDISSSTSTKQQKMPYLIGPPQNVII